MPTPSAIDAANEFRRKLEKQEAESAARMATIYGRIYDSLLDDINKLAAEIAAMDKLAREDIIKLARSQAILQQIEEQVTRFGGVVQGEITVIQRAAIQQGLDDALKMMQASLPEELPPEIKSRIAASFTLLPSDAVEAAAGLLGADSPLRAALENKYGQFVADNVETHLLDGLAKGQGPRQVAQLLERNLKKGLGTGLSSALTTIRTAQIKSHQIATHANYLANQNVVKEWVWVSALDSRCCLSCIEQHGTVHPITETLNDHYNGRCAAVPVTIAYRDLGLDIPEVTTPTISGEDWFNSQPAAVQREMMGGAMYDAYKAGQVGFGDFSRKHDDPAYGEMLREASLKDILGWLL